MNIFVLDYDIEKAARYHCDAHVVCMVKEYSQLLSSAHFLSGSWNTSMTKPTHLRHPCLLWATESKENYQWLKQLYFELAWEYRLRYSRVHLSFSKHWEVLKKIPELPSLGLSEFALAMPEELKVKGNAVQSYRNFYNVSKASFAKWKYPSETPPWFNPTFGC